MSEQFEGTVSIAPTAGGDPAVVLSGDNGTISAGVAGRDGDLVLRDANGIVRLQVDAQNSTLILRDDQGRNTVFLDARFSLLDLGAQGNEGDLRIKDNSGQFVFRFDANFAVLDLGAAGNEGDLRIHDNAGDVRIHLDGNDGDIKLLGADCAEEFAVDPTEHLEPGTVMVIGDDQHLQCSSRSYDRRVAGVLSGGGGLHPGIVLGRRPGERHRLPIALSGRVACRVDASNGPIRTGDLLTTSVHPGSAMKATDPQRGFGAIIGKALRGLQGDAGLLPILVALQ